MREKVWLGVISYQLNNDNFPKFCIELRELRTELNCKLPAVGCWFRQKVLKRKMQPIFAGRREAGLMTVECRGETRWPV